MRKDTILQSENPLVMGILNLTEDSFYAGSRVGDLSQLLSRAEQLITAGVDIIDIGACSTRPGALFVEEEKERSMIASAVEKLSITFPEVPISVDTFRSSVTVDALDRGAAMINDISAGTFDTMMLPVIAKKNPIYIMMHTPAKPENMQENPIYENVTQAVCDFFTDRLKMLCKCGGEKVEVVLDPGFGFGKTVAHNYELLANMEQLRRFGKKIMVGVSRKSMIYKLLSCTPQEALNGTSVIHTLALLKGADILRVHDPKEAIETIMLFNEYKRF